jgi:hypothetical protein
MLPNEVDLETGDVHIHVNVGSNIYTYTVTNLAASPIVEFEVEPYHAYNFAAPEGWDIEHSEDIFHAKAGNTGPAIRTGEGAEFSLRMSSAGAVLGYAPVKVRFQSGKTVTVPDVWAPVPEPRGYTYLIAVVILAIMLLHTAVVVYKKRRARGDFL